MTPEQTTNVIKALHDYRDKKHSTLVTVENIEKILSPIPMQGNTVEAAKEYFHKNIIRDGLGESFDFPSLMVAYAQQFQKQWVSDEEIEKVFPSTYAQINNINNEQLNIGYLEKYDIDFFDNYKRQEGAKWMRSKIFPNGKP